VKQIEPITSAPRIGWLVLLLALVTGALLVLALAFLRVETLRGGEQLTESLSQVIAEQTARTLQSVDSRLQVTVSRLQAMERARTLDEAAGRAELHSQLADLPFVRAIWVVDAQGRIAFGSEPGNVGLSVADREYVRIYREAPGTGFFVGPLVRSRGNGQWLISVSRPMHAADGRLTGVLTAAVEPGYFDQIWRAVNLGSQGAIALYHRGGQLMVRSPLDESALGRDFSQMALFTQYLPAAPAGMFIRSSGVDGIERVVSYRVLATYPQLVVAVGSGYGEMMEAWRRFALLSGLVWFVGLALAAGLTLMVHRQARSRRETERRFRELAQAVPQIVFITGARGEVQFVNQRWVETTGRAAEDAQGAGWQDLLHPADRTATVDFLRERLEAGKELQHEARLRYADGSYRWQLLRAVPVQEQPAGGMCWYGTATDVDDLKQAQARLAEQADLLGIAGRLARMGGWKADLLQRRIIWTEEAAALLDMSADVHPTIDEVTAMLAPGQFERVQKLARAALLEGNPFDVEVEMVTARGRQVWLRTIAHPVYDAEGRLVTLQGAQQDITPRVRMVEEIRQLNTSLETKVQRRTSELAQQEALFRTLAEQAPLPFWTVNTLGEVTFFSRAWYDLAGGAPPRWLGLEWLELVHPDDLVEVRENWRRSSAAGAVYAGTRRIRAPDGLYHTTTYRAAPVRNAAGEIDFWVGIDTDITDLMVNEAALRLANEQLEAFAYSVSHDLQSPLQRVLSFSRLLDEELARLEESKARHYLSRIRANAHTMAQLIDGLLALAHVSEVDIIRGSVNLSDMGTEILQRLQQDQPQRRVRWRVQPGLAVMADVRLMRSVLENLLGNAWKFTAQREEGVIDFGGTPARGEYFVRDNGAGFDMAYADRLFGTFQRLHDADEFPGTGIGLATVARAVTRQGGRVWGQSAAGEGATFWFTLPAVEAGSMAVNP
jgi:PAS domain S-box-containing protein